MAEYRGLTIKIGADTTSLTASLKGAQSAIASTQKQLRTLKQALKMDSSSTKASALYIGELQSQAVAAASKVAHLSTEMRRLSETTSKVDDARTIGQLAKDTDNVALSAQRAKQIYQGITADLSRYYTRLSDLASGVVRDFTNGLDSSLSQEERVKEIIENLGVLVDENGKALKFDVKRSDIDEIIAAIDELQARGVIKKGEAKKAVAEIKMLKAAFIEASDAYDDARLVQKLHTDTVEAAKLEAQFKSLAEEIADADKGSSLAKRWEEAQQALGILDKDASRAKAHFDALDAAAKIDPTNIDVASARTQALAESVVLAEGKADALRAVLASYDNRGIGRVAQSTIRAAENVEKWRTEFVDAQTEVNRVESALERARLKVAQLEATGKTNTKAYENATADVAELEVKLDGARQAAEHANAEFRRAKDIAAYKDIETQADEASVAVEKLKETFRKLAEVQVKARPDTELGKSWSKISEQVKRFGDDIDRASERVEALDAQMKIDPEDFDLAAAKSKALGEALTLAESKAASLLFALDSYEVQGIDKAAAGITSVSDNLDQAEQNAIEATARVNELELELKQLDDAKVDAKGEAWFELSRKWRETTEALYAARQAAEQANDELDRAKDIAAYENVRTQLEKATAAADEYRDAMVQADKVSLADGMREFTVAIDGLDADIAAAKREFEALDKAAKLDPSDLDLARERTDALRKVTDLTYQKSSELSRALGEYKSAGIDKVAQGTERLSEAAAKATRNYRESLDKVEGLRILLLEAYGAAKKLGEEKPDSDEYRAAADQVDKLGDELAEAVGSSKQLRSEMLELNAAVQYNDTAAAAQQVKTDIAELESMGRRSTESISTASVMILQEVGQLSRQVVSSVSTATYDLEEAYTNMLKTVDATEEQYEQLKEAAIQASLVQPVSADQILNVEALGGQLGFAADELLEFQRVANGLDISTNMNWEDAATDMAKFANIMKMDHADVGRYGAAIVDLGNNFATTEADISDMALRIAGAGASMGLTSADVLGLATALQSMGLTAEAGGSSISQIMVKVDKAVANGTAGIEAYAKKAGMGVSEFIDTVRSLEGDELSEFAKQFEMTGSQLVKDTVDQVDALSTWAETAKMTSEEFVKAWEEKPIKAIEALFSGMEAAGEEGTNLNILLEELGITTIRQSDVARRLANNSELVTQAVEASNAAWQENIALDTEVARRNESLSGRMDVLRNSFTALKTELGEGLAPLVGIATTALQAVVGVLDGMSVGAKATIISVAGLAGGLATVIPIASKVTETLSSLGAGSVIGGIKAVGASIGGLFTFSNLAFVAIGALAVAAANYMHQALENKRKQDDFNAALENMGGYAQHAADNSQKLADSLKPVRDEAHHSASSIEELTEAITEHNDKMNEIQTSYEVDADLMHEYKKVLDEVKQTWNDNSEQYEMTAEQMSIAQWALDGLNQQLGTNITMEQLLAGTYEDENGVIHSTISMLEELIEKRQQEAKIAADQELVTEATKNRFRADRNLYDAEMELAEAEEFVKQKRQEIMDQGFDYNTANAAAEKMVLDEFGESYETISQNAKLAARDSEAAANEQTAAMAMMANDRSLAKVTADVEGFYAKLDEAGLRSDALANISTSTFNEMLNKCGGDINQLAQDVIDYAKAGDNTLSAMRRLSRYTPEFDGAFKNIDMEAFATALDEAGGSIEDLERIGREGFDNLVESTGGDIDEMVARLASTTAAVEAFLNDNLMFGDSLADAGISLGYFAKECENAGISSEMLAQVGQYNFANLAKACDGDVGLMLQKIAEFNAAKLEGKDVVIDAEGNVVDRSAQSAIEDTTSAEDQLHDKSVNVSASGNVVDGSAARNVWDTVSAMFNLSDKTVKQTLIRQVVDRVATGGYRLHADGGIRKHADGFIANRYGPGVPLDIVGEAGAEAIIPLTNRRYSQPFADLLAEMISKHGGAGEGQIVNVNLNYSAGEDANQLARDLARAIQRANLSQGR